MLPVLRVLTLIAAAVAFALVVVFLWTMSQEMVAAVASIPRDLRP